MIANRSTAKSRKPRSYSRLPAGPIDLDTTLRVCKRCERELPLRQFRRRSEAAGYRHYTCAECITTMERERTAAKREAARRRKMSRLLVRLKSSRNDRACETVCERMLTEFGGVSAFSRYFAEYLRHARTQLAKQKRGGPLKQATLAVLRLWEHLCSARQSAASQLSPDALQSRLMQAAREAAASQSDEQLRSRLEDAARRVILADPEWAVRVMRRAGWEVTRSENTCANESCDMLS